MGDEYLAVAIAELVGAMLSGSAGSSLRIGDERGNIAGLTAAVRQKRMSMAMAANAG